ncbi:MAG: hypothetical protein ACLTBV_10570 [Enterocloster bolteae]
MISVAGHDTESALMAAPGLDKTKVFVSLGTSFIFGARVKAPVVNRESFHDRFKNMRGVGGTYSLCKDFPGFWILERCMEQWRKQVPRLDYEAVCAAAEKVRDNRTFIDISDDRFRVSGIICLKPSGSTAWRQDRSAWRALGIPADVCLRAMPCI